MSLAAKRSGRPSGPEWAVTSAGTGLGARVQAATRNPACTSRAAAALPSAPRPRSPTRTSPGGR